jgi:hypothetical protein
MAAPGAIGTTPATGTDDYSASTAKVDGAQKAALNFQADLQVLSVRFGAASKGLDESQKAIDRATRS